MKTTMQPTNPAGAIAPNANAKTALVASLRLSARQRVLIGNIKTGLAAVFGISLYAKYNNPEILTREDGLSLVLLASITFYFLHQGLNDRKGNPQNALLADFIDQQHQEAQSSPHN